MCAYPGLVSHRLVQGEAMKQSEIMKKKTRFPALILFLCGFLAGNLIPNILWKIKWQQKTLASIYFLSIFAAGNISGTEYLKELIKIRGSLFILSVLCGFSIFGVPLAVSGISHRHGSCHVHSAIWICRRSDRSRSVTAAVSFLYSSVDVSDGTGMGIILGDLEK